MGPFEQALNIIPNKASFDPDIVLDKIIPKKSPKDVTYVKNYREYLSRHGGPDQFLRRIKKISKDGEDAKLEVPTNAQYDKYVNTFREPIYGYDIDHDDPTFLIFDIKIIKNESPLFNSITTFLENYYDVIPEITERIGLYDDFSNALFNIFPSESYGSDKSGKKKHYIESIAGLDVFHKKIVKYPEDKITFTLSEDITLISHYLAESYNNLVFSYDTQRSIIPENLLRFNLQITIKDIRNMIHDNNLNMDQMPKIIYTLHDCQFDFFSTKSIEDTMTVNGWGTPLVSTPAKNTFTINFKSFSKIIAPYLNNTGNYVNKREIIDFKERLHDEFLIFDPPPNIETQDGTESKNSRFGSFVKKKVSDAANLIKNEASEIRSVLINKLSSEVSGFLGDLQQGLYDKFGFTITKVNVYYDDITDKVDNASSLLNDFLDVQADNLFNREERTFERLNRGDSVYSDEENSSKSLINLQINRDSRTTLDYLNYEKGTDIDGQGTYHNKEPNSSNRYVHLNDDGSFQDALFGEGDGRSGNIYDYLTDVHNDETYNVKFPDGDLHDDGQYNLKFPDSDTHNDSIYNKKFPDGDLHNDGQYNLKFPDGDTHGDSIYNAKFPDGDLHDDGQYNLKLPKDNLYDESIYTIKLPSGDLHDDNQYNLKLPKGNLYNESIYTVKLPSGDLHDDGQYNLKFPDGDVYPDGQVNDKIPKGEVYDDKEIEDKIPKGEVYDDKEIDDKKPSGNLYGKVDNAKKPPDGNVYK